MHTPAAKLDANKIDLLRRQQIRMGLWLAAICGTVSATLRQIVLRRGSVMGLHLAAAWRLPFMLGMFGALIYLIWRSLKTGAVITWNIPLERATRPRTFYLYIALMAFLACSFLALGIAIVYLNPTLPESG